MYIVYVLIQKGPIDFTKQLVPTRVHRCSSIEEAFEKKRQEEDVMKIIKLRSINKIRYIVPQIVTR